MTDRQSRTRRQLRTSAAVYLAGGLLFTVAVAWFGAWRSDLGSAAAVRVTPLEWDFDDIEFAAIWSQPLADRYIAVEDTRDQAETPPARSQTAGWQTPILGVASTGSRTSLIIDETGVFALTAEMQRLGAQGRLSELYDGHPNESPALPSWFVPDVGYDDATGTHWMLHLEDAAEI